MDPEIEELAKKLIEAQLRTDQSLNNLTRTVDKYVTAADARMRRIESRSPKK